MYVPSLGYYIYSSITFGIENIFFFDFIPFQDRHGAYCTCPNWFNLSGNVSYIESRQFFIKRSIDFFSPAE